MAESVLKKILDQELPPDLLFEWLSGKNHQVDLPAKFGQFSCTVGEFASYFLNYVHEDAPSYNFDSSNRITFTPKGIRNVDFEKRSSNESLATARRRSALFTDVKNDAKLYSYTCPVVTSKSFTDTTSKHDTEDFKTNQGATTPRLMKINSDCLDTSYTSPISPLYTRNSLNTPRNRNAVPRSAEKSLCFGDFVVQKKSATKKKAQRSLCDVTNSAQSTENKKLRRINPTNLDEKRFTCGFKRSENSFNFKNDFIELTVGNTNEQRNLLAEERLKIKNNIDDIVKTTNILKLQTFNTKVEINPLPDKVTFVFQLASEIYFLVSLLLSRQYVSESLNDSDSDVQIITDSLENQRDVFKTVHNCVYFAIGVLRTQFNFLRCIDRPTLKLLCENERVMLFSRDFYEKLLTIYNGKSEQVKEYVQMTQNNVCFMSDTDNRENFSTDGSFHAFRKQRDLFYEILRIWEQNHYSSGWSFSIGLGGKIKTLLYLHNDPVNYRHFARLFKMQLLTSCRQITDDEAISEERATLILTSLPNVNEDKLNRLKTRLTTKQDHTDFNSTPIFTGQQEFYKDFISIASNCVNFLQHLQDSLVLEIIKLSENISEELSESEERDVDVTMRNSYFASMRNLRISAKFLGFIESLPYKVDLRVRSDKVLKDEMEARKWYRCPFDLKAVLVKSLQNKTLTITIPWVCTYIAMLDYVTIRLAYFDDVIKILFKIYLSSDFRCKNDNIYDWALIRLSLGWLFELPHFPSELYFCFISKRNTTDPNFNFFGKYTSESGDKYKKRHKRLCLDELGIVNQTILYTFCPYLEGFRKLLLSRNTPNGGNAVKHITPLSAVDNSSDFTEKKLKNQLEEAFFNCQPVSVRKTVEFISERVASSCVKHICNKIVPEFKKTALERARIALQEIGATYISDGETENKLENIFKNKIGELSATYLKELQEICAAETEKLTSERISLTVNALLAVDELEQTKETCVTITKRLCIVRVQQWMDSHVNIGLFNKFKALHLEILRSFENSEREIKEKPIFQLPGGGRDIKHDCDSLNAVKIVEIIRRLSLDLIESKPTEDTVLQNLIKRIEITVSKRCDVNDQILSLINRMLVDLMWVIITHKFQYFDGNLQLFLNHWKSFVKPNEDHFKTLICPRNIMLMAQSKDASKSWSYLSKFVIKLIEMELLSCETFEAQCISIYKQEWDEGTLKLLSSCFRDVIDAFESETSRFSCLLSFVSSYCSEMEF